MSTKFVFLILPQMHLLDMAGPDQVIHEAIGFGADFAIEYCGIESSLKTSAGLSLGPIQNFKHTKLHKDDFLIIPGANTDYLTSIEFKSNKGLLNWIVTNYQSGINVCSICVGAFVLAECGLLDNKSCTTHFKKTRDLQLRYPKIKVIENILYTDHNGIYTSAGIVSGIDMMLFIIEKLKDSFFVHLVARELVVYSRRNGNSEQQSEFLTCRTHVHDGIHKVQDWIFENIHLKSNLYSLAEIANMSERNFTRIFKKETGITVKQFITIIRREKLKELVKNPDLSKITIANKLGLESEKQLSRIIKTDK